MKFAARATPDTSRAYAAQAIRMLYNEAKPGWVKTSWGHLEITAFATDVAATACGLTATQAAGSPAGAVLTMMVGGRDRGVRPVDDEDVLGTATNLIVPRPSECLTPNAQQIARVDQVVTSIEHDDADQAQRIRSCISAAADRRTDWWPDSVLNEAVFIVPDTGPTTRIAAWHWAGLLQPGCALHGRLVERAAAGLGEEHAELWAAALTRLSAGGAS